ncbi:ubiquinone biosynthesis protein COQ4, mitochondrial [Coprinopsis marcescibilis]|uniref:4-hydroxy-3-methoxy-5-polyprenylbenzoate decarboxylase n=1 Tax=Coprinopsis marcescibilis TaxID=230819 RepID=A0A5C3L3P3_COPMA|nr:ubiquinone biosynthesis protein COQ4, mitochondrial [Coprinopsis marcescibilis]
MSLSRPSSILRRVIASQRPSTLYAVHAGRNRRNVATKPNYEGHIPLNWFENALLTAGAAIVSISDPKRGDMVAALGETTAGPTVSWLRDHMLASTEGRQILKERPRINTSTVDMDKLAQLPDGTFGKAYITWLERCGVTPDTREPVHYIDDPELAYVMQRYRECHDFYHCICNMPVNVESELAIKYFEFANLGLPMTGLAALFGPLRLTGPKRERLFSEAVPWALKCGSSARSLITVYWEKRWEQNIEDMKKELGIWDGPEARWSKPLNEAKEAAERRGSQNTSSQSS